MIDQLPQSAFVYSWCPRANHPATIYRNHSPLTTRRHHTHIKHYMKGGTARTVPRAYTSHAQRTHAIQSMLKRRHTGSSATHARCTRSGTPPPSAHPQYDHTDTMGDEWSSMSRVIFTSVCAPCVIRVCTRQCVMLVLSVWISRAGVDDAWCNCS